MLREFLFSNINSAVHKLGHEVLQNSLQTLLYNMDTMHRPSPNIKEVMEFEKGISVKQSLEIFQVCEI
jgi:hypothetical protein